MRRWHLICTAALGFLLLQSPALPASQEQPEQPPLSFKLETYGDTYMKGNAVKGTMEIFGGNKIVSPKKPPYKLEMTCNHLLANSLNANTATMLIATQNVKFIIISMPKEAAEGATGKKNWPTRCDGAGELVVYETAVDSSTKTPAHYLRIKRAKDNTGKAVPPKLVMSQPGKPGDQLVTVNAYNEIDYNIDTGEYSLDQPTIESNGKETQ